MRCLVTATHSHAQGGYACCFLQTLRRSTSPPHVQDSFLGCNYLICLLKWHRLTTKLFFLLGCYFFYSRVSSRVKKRKKVRKKPAPRCPHKRAGLNSFLVFLYVQYFSALYLVSFVTRNSYMRVLQRPHLIPAPRHALRASSHCFLQTPPRNTPAHLV